TGARHPCRVAPCSVPAGVSTREADGTTQRPHIVRGAPAPARPAAAGAGYFAEAFFLAGDFLAGAFLAGALARRSDSSSEARASVSVSTVSPLRREALVSPSVTYGPKRPSLTSICLPETSSTPSSRNALGAAACRPRRLGSE